MARRIPYIEVKRELLDIASHIGCGGIVFKFRIEQADLSTFIGSMEIRRMRKAVRKGADFVKLTEEFEIGLDEFYYYECEKCGEKWSYPTKGGP